MYVNVQQQRIKKQQDISYCQWKHAAPWATRVRRAEVWSGSECELRVENFMQISTVGETPLRNHT